MIRYSGQELPANPSIAVFANDAIGNFVMATPLLQLLREERVPRRLDYFGGTRTHELQEASDLMDDAYELLGSDFQVQKELLDLHGAYDLIVNLESSPFAKAFVSFLAAPQTLVAGPCAGPGGRGELPYSDDDRGDLWRDKEWIADDLTAKYPFLKSGFISEIFARLCYLGKPLPSYRVAMESPAGPVPDVLIATAASLPEKLWDYQKWQAAILMLRSEGLSVGLLGAPPKDQSAHWIGADEESLLVGAGLAEDLRGCFTLPQVTGALSKAKSVLTLDNGILHLAVAAGAPAVGLYRHGIHRLWAPPSPCLTVLTAGEDRPVSEIGVDTALAALRSRLREAA